VCGNQRDFFPHAISDRRGKFNYMAAYEDAHTNALVIMALHRIRLLLVALLNI